MTFAQSPLVRALDHDGHAVENVRVTTVPPISGALGAAQWLFLVNTGHLD